MNPQMRVVFLSPVANLGGAERSLLDLLASLRAARPAASLHLLAFEDGPLLEHARRVGVSTEVLPLPDELRILGDAGVSSRSMFPTIIESLGCAPAALAFALVLHRRLVELAPDVIHTNGVKAHVLGAIARTRSSRLVWHVRDYLSRRRLMRRLLPLLRWRADGVLANSHSVAEDTQRLLWNAPVVVLLNGIDINDFRPEGSVGDLDRLADVPPPPSGTLRVGLVATFASWKGHSIFLAAAERIQSAKTAPPVRFYIVGGPVYSTTASQRTLKELQAEAVELGLGSGVAFVPFQEDIALVYRALDVVVHASTSPEPFGRTIAEAMACARPVIATSHCGAAAVIENGSNGLVVPPGSAEELADAILELLESEPLRRDMGRRGRATAEQVFTRERLGHEVLDCYSRIRR